MTRRHPPAHNPPAPAETKTMKPSLLAVSLAALVLAHAPSHAGEEAVVQLTNQHLDLRAVYDPGARDPLVVLAVDEDHGASYTPDQCVLVVGESARLTLPAGTPFGNEGDPIHVLPQSQDPDLLDLGVSAEGIPGGVFAGDLSFRFSAVSGPGKLFLWKSTSPGSYDVAVDSGDGLGVTDQLVPSIGGHEHFNWGFTAPGVYRVTLVASGRPIDAGVDLASPAATFEFHVLPLPPEPARLRVVGIAADGALRVELAGIPGSTHEVFASSDLEVWTLAGSVTLAGSTREITVPKSGSALFVRAVAR
ncbi:MAG: hypothetical protein DVB31_14925 [Verrucomicrobia bacterium]|nr:MAG: hypothetical protein DVB31_14925 [Verrucomicrobiota bacterium]